MKKPAQKKTLKEIRKEAKERKETKRFCRDFKNGLIETGLTAKGWSLFYEIDGNESAFDTDKVLSEVKS